ncbi:VTT domain-containing protein [Legionella sp. km772]|uniref:VTT domain-containing protein n=1 Tax=Legionella sp. km772 TaxID=2498111 RepID=UPI000F8E7CC0|nr:VTT domain-containing protein [Legionella sp. km772]RUR11984.1 phosphatase PAP2 family protein [Legionella sp. km772]
MNLFADYIHPLTNWLQANPNWALFFTFIVALSESLAIVGSIIPGSVTMTAIGILAGSGILRIDLTLIASSLGAICGDSLSYALGYFYSEKLVDMWPFKKYPSWLAYGKDFFSRHGGKSVLIGRFVGPLRSIIPVIAGIMHMKQWRFLLANFISGIGWSLLYVMPGVLIGAAGHELSTESATRLFIITLILLVIIWVVSLTIKWIILKLHSFFKNNLHDFWMTFKKDSLLNLYNLFTPPNEANHYTTAGLVLITLLCLLSSLSLIALNIWGDNLKGIDLPVYLLLQSFHTYLLEAVFIVFTQLTSKITLAFLYIGCSAWFIYNKKFRATVYLALLIIFSTCTSYLLSKFIFCPRPQGLLITMEGSSFPNHNLLVATSLYGFIFYYIKNKYSLLTNTLRSFLLIILGLSGLGSIYLGDNWLSDVLASYFIGACICLITCLFYRKENASDEKKSQSVAILSLLFISIIFSSSLSIYFNFKVLVYAHTPYEKEYTLDSATWWDQQQPILPLYRLNRVGKRTSLLNIQYAGDLSLLENSLEEFGWETHNESFFTKILMRVNDSNSLKLPLLTQLLQNKRPELVMTYKNKQNNRLFQLIVWESNYNLRNLNNPLWIGTLYSIQHEKRPLSQGELNALTYLTPALHQFTLRKIALPKEMIKTTLFPSSPHILLIKNHDS